MNSIPTGKILGYLQNRNEELVEFLRQLVLAESPSTVPESQMGPLTMLAGSLEEIGFRTEHRSGRISGGTLIASLSHNHGSSRQLLLGHCDTVWPIGTLAKMPMIRTKGRLKGPGVFDMKAGLAQIVFALKTLRDLGLNPAVAPVVLINSDEEIGSGDSEPHIRRLARRSERAFVLEPAMGRSGLLKTARKGVGQFTITVKGIAAHAGLEPQAGASAILELSYLIQRLHDLNDPERGVTVNVGMIDGGLRPNVVAPESRAIVDVRVLRSEDGRRIEREIHSLAPVTPGVNLKIQGAVSRPPLEHTPRNRRLWMIAREMADRMKIRVDETMAGGASDGNITSQLTATLDGLGAVGGGAHARHEFVYLDKLVERTALLAHLLLAPPLPPPDTPENSTSETG